MTQPIKNSNNNRSFLDKFQGRTNKVSKLGVQAVLTNQQTPTISSSNNSGRNKNKSKSNTDEEYENQFRKVDLDVLIPSNPQKNSMNLKALNADNIVKRRDSLGRSIIKSQNRQDYVPSAYTPQTATKDTSLNDISSPPSRSLSNSTGNSRGKYMFGKYLKLDKQALSHIQFLQSIQQKSYFKKNRGASLGIN